MGRERGSCSEGRTATAVERARSFPTSLGGERHFSLRRRLRKLSDYEIPYSGSTPAEIKIKRPKSDGDAVMLVSLGNPAE